MQTVVGVLVVKEMRTLTDAEALAALDYDLRWQVALDLEPEEAHCCQKTAAFRERYAKRAGIERTNSELKRMHGLGRVRIRGL